jgi:ABC-type sulfate/molybdate transport systems ATPase subunit
LPSSRVCSFDKPFEALDAKVRRDLRRWLLELHNKTGHTTVFVTHDQEEALELADRVVMMSEGRIEQVGTPDQIYDTPNSPFVFSFIGESSVLPVRVEQGEVWLDGTPLDLPAGDVPNSPANLFLRPHDIEVVDDQAGAILGVVLVLRRHAGLRRGNCLRPERNRARACRYCSRTSTLSAAPFASVTVRRTKPGPSGSKKRLRPFRLASSGMPLSSTVMGGVPPVILMGRGSGSSPARDDSSRLAPFGGNTMCTGGVSPKAATAFEAKR